MTTAKIRLRERLIKVSGQYGNPLGMGISEVFLFPHFSHWIVKHGNIAARHILYELGLYDIDNVVNRG